MTGKQHRQKRTARRLAERIASNAARARMTVRSWSRLPRARRKRLKSRSKGEHVTTPTDHPAPLPTPAEAMRNAVAEAGNRRWQAADTWLHIAVELRNGEESAITPERHAPQDIVLRACHHAVPVVSLSPAGRWWHPGSKTWCDDTEPAEFPTMARFVPSLPDTTALDDRPATLADTDTRLRVIGDVSTQVIERPIDCRHCPDRVERYGIEGWWHTFTHEEACVPTEDGVPRGTYAYPRDLTQVNG